MSFAMGIEEELASASLCECWCNLSFNSRSRAFGNVHVQAECNGVESGGYVAAEVGSSWQGLGFRGLGFRV